MARITFGEPWSTRRLSNRVLHHHTHHQGQSMNAATRRIKGTKVEFREVNGPTTPTREQLARHVPKGREADLDDQITLAMLQRVAASKVKQPRPARSQKTRDGEPSVERLAKAEGFFVIGDDEQGTKIFTLRDTPLDRMFSRRAIGGVEYSALQRYRSHWHHAGLEPGVGSVDLNRIFSSDPGSMSGMAKSEAQAHHRGEWRAARELLGHRPGIVVDNVVCAELPLDVAGYSIGWTNKPQAIAAATEVLRDAGYRLGRHWGIG
jgi:hypothetical protein